MKKRTLFFLIFLLSYLAIFAGSFRPLGIKEGLSSRQVYQICKDSAGFIWAYTHMGIDRYDGNEFRHYKLDETVEARDQILSSTTMTCDGNGNLWIALKNGRVYAYSRHRDAFSLRIDLAGHMDNPFLYHILFDADNNFWLCTSDGIYGWQEDAGLSPAALQGEVVNCLVQSGKDEFYAGTIKGIYRLQRQPDGRFASAEALLSPPDMHIQALFASGDKLFAGTFSEGAFVVDRTTGAFRSLDAFIPHVPIRAFAQASGNELLIGADGAGVFRIDIATAKLLTHYLSDEDDERTLSGNTVSDICVDEFGAIWVSTSTNGISYLDPNLPDVRRTKHERNNANSLKSDHINVLFQDSEGDYWCGTNNGISLYRPAQKKWQHFLDGTGQSAKVVLALAEDGSGNIWAGGYGTGLYCIDKKTGRVRAMEKRKGASSRGVSTDYIYAIYAEGDYLWIGGIEGDFTRYNRKTDTYTYFPIDCIGDIKPAAGGALLIAGCNGLGIFNKLADEVQWHRQFGDVSLRYPIRCLMQSSAGDIWLATDGEGLVRFNPVKGESRIYTTNDGFASNSINSVIEDDNGRIWFSTEKELYCLDLTKDVIINANDFLDITWGYYNPNAALKLRNGYLSFGTAEGVISFSPSLEFSQHGPIQLILTDFKLLYESVKAGTKGSLLKTNINDTKKIDLDYNRNSFSLSFSAINFTAPHRIRYAYMLENYDEEWEHSNDLRSVNYMNLSPGTYTFCLRAFDKYTGQQIGERNLKIVISRPFWVSWWALLIYFVLFSVFIYLFIQYRRHKANEDRVKEKIRSFISIAHDIRTPITLIKAPLSELEAQKEMPAESKKIVAVAVKNAEKLMAMVTQLLDLQKTELHAECLKVSPYDVKAYLEEKMAEFHMAAMQKGVELDLQVEEDMPRVWMDRDKMDHIIDNLLSNALKYTEQGVIHIVVKTTKTKWTIEVRDTGIGIPEEEQSNIFNEYYRAQNAMNYREGGSGIGLMITRRIVKQHHGSISFSSVEGKGTTFTVSFPRKINSGVVVERKKDKREATVAGAMQDKESGGKNVLLLAEDDADMREYMINSLSSEYNVIAVPDGGKALEMAREINPDLIISDIVMPVLEGDELCRILKSSVDTSHIPIILLTALSERENIIFGLEAGANDYIIKPFDLSVLKVRIRNVLQNRQHLRDTMLSMDTPPEDTDYTSQLDKEFIDKVMEVIQEEMGNSELSINDFCRLLGMSRTSVYNKIKTLTGQGPNDFIRIMRLNKAKELLESRRFSISEVAAKVGFSDPKYFSTCFKKQFGTSPSKI